MILLVNCKDGSKRRIQLSPEHILSSGRPGDKKPISFPALVNKLKESAEALEGENYSSFQLLNYDSN